METVDAPPPAELDDAALLQRYVRDGNREALGVLFARHEEAAFHLARRFFRTDADADAEAEDAVQAAFVTLLQAERPYRGEASVKTWMMGFVVNACQHKTRGETRRKTHQANFANARPVSIIPANDKSEMVQAVGSALEKLPHHYRTPLWLRYYEGLTPVDVAIAMRIPEKTVRSQLARGLDRLRQSLAAAGYSTTEAILASTLPALAAESASPALMQSVARIAAGAIPKFTAKTAARRAVLHSGNRGGGMQTAATMILATAAVAAIAVAFESRSAKMPMPAPAPAARPAATAHPAQIRRSVENSPERDMQNVAEAGIAIKSGGGGAGCFVADIHVTGGKSNSTSAAIDASGVTDPAPQAVYQSERYGDFTYIIPQLRAGASYKVRLHFAEIYWRSAGQRVFNVGINGQAVLSKFDIIAAAGAANKAVVREFESKANEKGQIVISYMSIVNYAKSSGIEIRSMSPRQKSDSAEYPATRLASKR